MAIAFGFLVGLALGLTGGGGSILAVPLLIYGLDMGPKTAVPTALAAVALTAAVGAGDAARARLLEVRAGLIFAAGGVVAAPAGVFLAERVADTHIVIGFALLMLIVGARLWWQAGAQPGEAGVVRAGLLRGGDKGNGVVCRYSDDGRLRLNAPCSAVLVAAGLLTGLLAGFFGVGGGFLIVPALMLVTQMGIHRAVATSLLAITLIGLAGLAAAYVTDREIPWVLTGLFVIGGIAGMGVGRRSAALLAGPRLQRLFAFVVVVLAAAMLSDQWFHWIPRN